MVTQGDVWPLRKTNVSSVARSNITVAAGTVDKPENDKQRNTDNPYSI